MDLKIECPQCGAKIDVSQQIAELVTERGRAEADRLVAEERKKTAAQTAEQVRKAAEEAGRKAREEERARLEKESNDTRSRMEAEKKRLEALVATKAQEVERNRAEQDRRLAAAQEELERAKKSAQMIEERVRGEERLKIQKQAQAEAVKMQANLRTLQDSLASKNKEMEAQRMEQERRLAAAVDERGRNEAEKVRLEMGKAFQEKAAQKDLQIAEIQKKLLESQSKAQELEAKLSQGSAQSRGIIAEEDLFQLLKKGLSTDRCQVEKRGQGKKGTDIIVHVHKDGNRLGSIIIDDKWAGEWGRDWPEKVWGDMQMHKADFAYIAVNPTAFPDELKEARFGIAPCRRAGVKVWVMDRSNPAFLLGILSDGVEKILKLAEIRAVYGAGSESVEKFQAYLTGPYEIDLREKAKFMSAAVKSLNDLHKKVNTEYNRIFDALNGYWTVEERAHRGLMGCFGEETSKPLPQIEFNKDSGQ